MSKILLLEPNRLLARQYKTYLQGRGHIVTTSEDAQTAILTADKVKPDAIIIELLLAGHSGIEFLYEFRSYTEWKHIPALIMTSLAPHETDMKPERLKELGVAACLYKAETSLAKLATLLERALAPKPA